MKGITRASEINHANFMEQHQLFSPEGRAAGWRIEVALRGECPQCKKKGMLRHENHAWNCWSCGYEFSEEEFLRQFPSPFAGPEPEPMEIKIIDRKVDTL